MHTSTTTQTSKWPFIKMLLLVAGLGLIVVTGLGFTLYYALTETTEHPTAPAVASGDDTQATGAEYRDQVAAAPMMSVAPQDALGGSPVLGQVPTAVMPQPVRMGRLGIPSGYPQTGEGAAVQLGEVLVSVLGRMDVQHGLAVRQEWFEDPDVDGVWPVLVIVQDFLRAGQLTDGLPAGAWLQVAPVGMQVKGSDGDGWHVVCVLLDVTYTYRAQQRLAYGHCERMAWQQGGWVIAAGEHPVPAPSTWPGTQQAIDAGWLAWEAEG